MIRVVYCQSHGSHRGEWSVINVHANKKWYECPKCSLKHNVLDMRAMKDNEFRKPLRTV